MPSSAVEPRDERRELAAVTALAFSALHMVVPALPILMRRVRRPEPAPVQLS